MYKIFLFKKGRIMDTYSFLLNGAELAEQYQNSVNEDEKKCIVMKVFTGVYFNIDRLLFSNNSEDFKSDFALYFYERIPSLLKNYNPKYSAFTTYAITYLKLSARSFFHQQMIAQNTNEAIIAEKKISLSSGGELFNDSACYASETYVPYEKDISLSDLPKIKCKSGRDDKYIHYNKSIGSSKNEINKKDSVYFSMTYKNKLVFLLACKSCLFLDKEITEKIANEIDMDEEYLENLLEKLRQHCLHRQAKINKTLAKRNSHYIKMKASKNFLDSFSENKNSVYMRTMKTHKGNYKAWLNAQNNNKRQIKYPSNRIIGKYLDISKSSVDNNLEKALKELYT